MKDIADENTIPFDKSAVVEQLTSKYPRSDASNDSWIIYAADTFEIVFNLSVCVLWK